jgi:alpha-beta hydrolase superfamily lysophospholipase
MRDDLLDAVEAAHARYPGLPVFALGESMGGAVLLTALAGSEQPRIAGAILVAPAVWSRADMPLLYRGALFFAAHLLPGLILSNNAASHVITIVPSDNVPMLRALARDPLFQKKTRSDTVYGLVNLMDEARAAPAHIADPPPILFLYGKHDQIIPAEPTEAVIAALKAHKPKIAIRVHRYAHGYHMLLRDLEGPLVWRDILDWIGATAAPGRSFSFRNRKFGRDIMADRQQRDLRKQTGKPGVTKAEFAGEENQHNRDVKDNKRGAHTVKPLAGDSGGVAPGQVTKSN